MENKMKLIKKIVKPNKKIISIGGIKFSYGKKKPASQGVEAYKNTAYNKNRFYNNIIDQIFPTQVKKGILEERFYKMVGYFPNLDHPRSFNEKLNWLKLYYRDPLMTKCFDKITFKDYICEQLGEGYTVPLLGVYKTAEEIDFDKLPQQFVIKSNCGWGSLQVGVVKDKSKADLDKIKQAANSWLIPWNNYYYQSFEWDSKDVVPQIVVEEFVGELEGDVPDYKFMCFNGEPKCLFVVADRRSDMALNFYDMDWNLLPFTRKYPNTKYPLKKPKNFEKMIEIARKLAQPFPFVRVDFYDLEDRLYVGELTFMPGGGVEAFDPVEWDYKMGELLQLPEKSED